MLLQVDILLLLLGLSGIRSSYARFFAGRRGLPGVGDTVRRLRDLFPDANQRDLAEAATTTRQSVFAGQQFNQSRPDEPVSADVVPRNKFLAADVDPTAKFAAEVDVTVRIEVAPGVFETVTRQAIVTADEIPLPGQLLSMAEQQLIGEFREGVQSPAVPTGEIEVIDSGVRWAQQLSD